MHTLDDLGSSSSSPWARWRRDARVALRIARMVVAYVVRGGMVRLALRRRAARGRTFWVDEWMSRR